MGSRLGLAFLVLLACSGSASKPAPADRDWVLVAVGERTDLVGQSGKPATLRLDSATSRAAGFGGCNRFSGSYELAGESLKFGPTASTKMYCEPGMKLEDAYFAALGSVARWSLDGAELVLSGAAGPVLRFEEGAD